MQINYVISRHPPICGTCRENHMASRPLRKCCRNCCKIFFAGDFISIVNLENHFVWEWQNSPVGKEVFRIRVSSRIWQMIFYVHFVSPNGVFRSDFYASIISGQPNMRWIRSATYPTLSHKLCVR